MKLLEKVWTTTTKIWKVAVNNQICSYLSIEKKRQIGIEGTLEVEDYRCIYKAVQNVSILPPVVSNLEKEQRKHMIWMMQI